MSNYVPDLKAFVKKTGQILDVLTLNFAGKTSVCRLSEKSDKNYSEKSISFFFDDIEILEFTGFRDKDEVKIYNHDFLFFEREKIKYDLIVAKTPGGRFILQHKGAYFYDLKDLCLETRKLKSSLKKEELIKEEI